MSSTNGGIPITLTGVSGKQYPFGAYPRTSSWNSVAGVYVILRDTAGGTVLYVGETEDLKQRLSNHHRQACFDRNNWTHLAFLGEGSETQRLQIERDLMDKYQPVCNRQV